MMLDIEEIKKIIPHRDPFLLIDGAEIIEPEKSARGFKKLTGNEDFFRGHFPGEPVMPGVLIIESMAQLGAVLALNIEKYKGKKIYFTSIDNVKFRKKLSPAIHWSFLSNLFHSAIRSGAAKLRLLSTESKSAQPNWVLFLDNYLKLLLFL